MTGWESPRPRYWPRHARPPAILGRRLGNVDLAAAAAAVVLVVIVVFVIRRG